jgi:hypothetical protein
MEAMRPPRGFPVGLVSSPYRPRNPGLPDAPDPSAIGGLARRALCLPASFSDDLARPSDGQAAAHFSGADVSRTPMKKASRPGAVRPKKATPRRLTA